MVTATAAFADRLAAAITASRSLLCLGLDPDGVADADAAERQCRELLDATLDDVCAVKPNMAFFERHGSSGYAVLERLRAAIPPDRMLIIDGKRGDIGNTATAYAAALFDVLGADAVTVNPLMGRDSVEPFVGRPGRGVFLVARTSNPGAADFLDRGPGTGPALYERIVREALTWDEPAGTVGFVVGATAPGAVRRVRELAPTAPLLLPGVGAQGGALEEAVAAAVDAAGAGAVVPVSRGISAAPEGPAAAARALRDRIDAVRAGR